MKADDLVDVALTLREQIDFLWNFYVTACAILIGWTFSSRMVWSRQRQRVVMALFTLFAIVNLSALFKDYRLLELALAELRLMPEAGGHFVGQFSTAIGLGSSLAATVHVIGDAVILLVLRQRTDVAGQTG